MERIVCGGRVGLSNSGNVHLIIEVKIEDGKVLIAESRNNGIIQWQEFNVGSTQDASKVAQRIGQMLNPSTDKAVAFLEEYETLMEYLNDKYKIYHVVPDYNGVMILEDENENQVLGYDTLTNVVQYYSPK